MAINYPNFLNAPSAESPAKNILENVLKGYQMEKEPEKMAAEQQKTDLANALQKKALEHYDEKYALDKELKKAKIKQALQTKIGGSAKANGEFANFLVANPNATPDEKLAAYNEIHGKKMEHEQTIINRSKDVVAGNSFDKLPINDKKQTVALFKGMNVDPVEAVSLARKGVSPSQYAQEHDIDISQVQPDYALGEQNVKDVQRASAYMDEIDILDKHINQGLGKYQNKIFGYSLEQIADAAEGSNPDQQGRALAARALLPELNALRLKIAGGNIGIEALRELEHKSLGQMNIIEGLVDEKTYNAAQKYMRQWIEEAGRTRINSLNKFSMLKTRLQKGAEAEAESGMGNDPLGLF